MNFEQSIICKLGGYVDSNPELLISYPPIDDTIEEENQKEIITLCLPFGCKAGDIIEKKYNKNTLLSFVFSIEKTGERDDLFSFSILLNKKQEIELYKSVIQQFIDNLEENGLLSEDIFKNNQELIYYSFNEETDLEIEGISIPLSEFFEKKREELKNSELDVKGSFF
jgi:hypothetical protein